MNALLNTQASPKDSWLSLVAETVGVTDCGIARVCLVLEGRERGELRAIVQIQDAEGQVLGAEEFFGVADDFRAAMVEVGYSAFSPKQPLRVVAWLASPAEGTEPESMIAPPHASVSELRSIVALKLILGPSELIAA